MEITDINFDELTEEDIEQLLRNQYNLIRNKTINILTEFNKKLIEREEVIPLLILALYCRQNILLFGEAGVSKTRMMLLLASLTGYKDYNINLAEITSPVDMIGTKEDLDNPDIQNVVNCQIALFDEIFKAKENGILHSLLNVIREKKVTIGGRVKNIDLKMAIGSSNEFGTDPALIPFNDRFPIKTIVRRIQNEDNFLKYWEEDFEKDFDFTITTSDKEIDSIIKLTKKIKEEEIVKKFILEFRDKILQEKLQFSDRAFGDSKTILKVCAILNGRDHIDISDVFLFNFMGWVDENNANRIYDIINLIVFGNKNELIDNMNNFATLLQNTNDKIQGKIEQALNYRIEIHSPDTFNSLKEELIKIFNEFNKHNKFINKQLVRKNTHAIFEKKIEDNLFIKNYKDTVFDDVIIKKLNEHKSFIDEKVDELNTWIEINTNTSVYLQNMNKFKQK